MGRCFGAVRLLQRERALIKEHPATSKTSVTPYYQESQDEVWDALEAALERLQTALSRFNEATGDQVDGANLELTAAQSELQAVFARSGNTLSADKVARIRELLCSGVNLRPEFRTEVITDPSAPEASAIAEEDAERVAGIFRSIPGARVSTSKKVVQ